MALTLQRIRLLSGPQVGKSRIVRRSRWRINLHCLSSQPGLRLADVSWRRHGCWLPAGCISRVRASDSGCASATGQPHTSAARPLLTGPRRPDRPFSWWAFGSAPCGRGHAVFRPMSLLNTPLFVGFAGFVSKLWLAIDEHGVYRGLYKWDGAQQAEDYTRALWRVLALVSVPGTIHYRVLPGLGRDDLLSNPWLIPGDETGTWWRLTAAPAPVP